MLTVTQDGHEPAVRREYGCSMFGQAAPKAAIALCDPDGIVCRSISTQMCATAAGQRVTARYACCSALAAADLIWLQERSATQSAYPYSLCSLSLETVMSQLYGASTAAVYWSKLHIAAIALCDQDDRVCQSHSTQTCVTAARHRVTAHYACCSAPVVVNPIWLQERSHNRRIHTACAHCHQMPS